MTDCGIELCGERLVLMPERAAYWPAKKTLLIADTHWGKAATLRAAAIPVPRGTTSADLARLTSALKRSGAERLVILGDAIHARRGREEETLNEVRRWRTQFPSLDVLVVRGNHDRGAGDPPEDLRFRCVDEPFTELPFVLCHFPKPSDQGYVLAGHTHPAVRLRGPGMMRARLLCFHFTARVGTLPAFGEFTGAAVLKPQPGDRVYGIAGDEVIPVR